MNLVLVKEEDITFTPGHITVPLMAITEGDLPFPINPLLRQVLSEYKLTPCYLTVNSFRIINVVRALREKNNLVFNIFDLFGVYSMSRNKGLKHWFFNMSVQ